MRVASILLAAAAAALAMPSVAASAVMEKAALSAPRGQRRSTAQIGSGWSVYGSGRRAGYGWTNMHARRVARKKRAVAAHRRRTRGRR